MDVLIRIYKNSWVLSSKQVLKFPFPILIVFSIIKMRNNSRQKTFTFIDVRYRMVFSLKIRISFPPKSLFEYMLIHEYLSAIIGGKNTKASIM